MRTNVISRAGSTPAIGNPERSMAQRGASDLFPQLPLGVRLRDGATFANYWSGSNQHVVSLLPPALQRGNEMPADVASLLMRRCRRDMAALFALLDELDHASLAAQRRLTVPFVKSVLDAGL